ncbi:hypothetical protein CDAR_289331 [Caerostris darwini]|uniref:Uncharacterized protein n=1 Tax=Caerostris darwini TaxID=1538125 RepID=A0AAV4PKW6_9ARAC|nr:hypothetical protein CDAR_289331 [Caerostris darwini]
MHRRGDRQSVTRGYDYALILFMKRNVNLRLVRLSKQPLAQSISNTHQNDHSFRKPRVSLSKVWETQFGILCENNRNSSERTKAYPNQQQINCKSAIPKQTGHYMRKHFLPS